MHKYLSGLFFLTLLSGCDVNPPVPADSNSYSFSGKSYKQAYTCTAKAAEAAGFTLDTSPVPDVISGKVMARDPMQDNVFTGTFTLDEKARTVNVRIEKHLANNLSLVFDNKNDIDDLLNKFQASFSACIAR